MTPAINWLTKHKVAFSIHEYDHDPANTDFGQEAVDKLQLQAESVFKTLLACDPSKPKQLLVAIVPVSSKLNLKALAKAAKVKKLAMAEGEIAQRVTGYLLGGISPLGQKQSLATFIDESAMAQQTIYVSGGKRGLDIGINPTDLVTACQANVAAIKE
ncbi:Cys-tRNA(Pro) deacylase [Motilimonas pumila]|uniref:Cys-tRNA(Pro)/Cys-tRNA(Cys) deacylase n=1 Tax=Motilimonas pumila TaxID=2303987 RepID=A0A418YD26_9GAMM|nr:Cys-tRNA(Pro) deacylase [Motilimonas pumila]RJG42416.1 Cys-tRNA(Pro) deacylase [Motilimonas pumila]